MKKILSILLAAMLVFAMNGAVFAESGDEVTPAAVETTQVDEVAVMETFTTFTTTATGASVATDPLDENNKVLKLDCTGRGQNVNIPAVFPAAADFAVSLKIYAPLPNAVNGRMFYLQMINAAGAAPQLQFWETTAQNTGYRFLDGVSGVSGNIASGIFTADTYTDFSFSVDKTSGIVTYNVGGIQYIQTYTEAKKPGLISNNSYVRFYAYNNGIQPVYIDDVKVTYKKSVEYDPESLTESFDAAMDYSADTPCIKITNGKTSDWLGQEIELSLIDAEDDTDITDVDSVIATKVVTENEEAEPIVTGSFEFSSDLPASITPGYYYVNIAQWIDGAKKSETSKRLYIATAEHLADLPGDFSSLPADETAAKAVVESYLPCFLTDEEMTELFPKEDDSYTTQGSANLSFITKYFQNCGETFTLISEVQTEFGKAKGYLSLKNAANAEETEEVLTEGGYLATYLEDEVFTENKEAFFTHFDTKRTNEANPLLSDEAVEGALRYAYALTAINSAERSEIQALVAAYNDIYLINLEAEGIDKVDADTLYSSLYKKNYTDITKIDEDFAAKLSELLEKVDEVPEEEQETGSNIPSASQRPSGDSNISTGGGGGGGGKTVVKTDVPVVQPEIAPEEPRTSVFKDTDGHWAEKEIELLYKNGITTGFEDGNFKPENPLTRAEMVAMLARILPGEESGDNPFSDVAEGDWYYSAAKEAAALGVVVGTDGNFLPNDAITREQLSVMIYRALNPEESASAVEISFADSEDVASYAAEAIAYLVERGIISGYPDNTVRPKNNTSRAEAAKLLCAAFSDIIK